MHAMNKETLRLYAVTDRAWLNGRSLAECVRQALLGGVTMVQLREKNLAPAEFLAEAREIHALCREFGVPFIVNDNLEVALVCDAEGLHVGQDDLEVAAIRKVWPADKIIGVSAQTVAQARQAEAAGASYLGVGAVFPTATKSDAVEVPRAELLAITKNAGIPIVAIGGIHQNNLGQLADTGVAGVALVSEIFAAPNITANAQVLRAEPEHFSKGSAQ